MKENTISIHWYISIVAERPGYISVKFAFCIINVVTPYENASFKDVRPVFSATIQVYQLLLFSLKWLFWSDDSYLNYYFCVMHYTCTPIQPIRGKQLKK